MGEVERMDRTYLDVTEIAGEEISSDQLFRICNRYYWAASQCANKEVVEVACGSGQGIGLLQKVAKHVIAADVSEPILATAREHYGATADLRLMDAQELQLEDKSVDVVIMFEALYYLEQPQKFAAECQRVLKPGGFVLISNANKDLFDFNPSPYSYDYHGVRELEALFAPYGFTAEFWGSCPVRKLNLRQRILRHVKRTAVALNLIPKTMRGKRLLKRVVFGQMTKMPREITEGMVDIEELRGLPNGCPDKLHRVIYARLTKAD